MERTVAIALAGFPYWAVLQLMRPWRQRDGIRLFARRSLEVFFWINNLWAIVPLMLGQYLISGTVTWTWAIIAYVLVALLFHSVIAHTSEDLVKRWETRG